MSHNGVERQDGTPPVDQPRGDIPVFPAPQWFMDDEVRASGFTTPMIGIRARTIDGIERTFYQYQLLAGADLKNIGDRAILTELLAGIKVALGVDAAVGLAPVEDRGEATSGPIGTRPMNEALALYIEAEHRHGFDLKASGESTEMSDLLRRYPGEYLATYRMAYRILTELAHQKPS